ncbi:hypothetical protein ACJMK2_010010 [Sinanodonta woodiana]|uniref:Uncharacterized protein n=1 Tax=Sinanodonta woodiana TaxID=1069815 RepID=A0ABD3VE04_SINWO
MGYDVDRFMSPVNDDLLCSICKDVLEEPVQAPCEHAFCRQCIEGWLVHETTCPEDRQPLSISRLRPLFRYMRNDLARLNIRCKNHTQGCNFVTMLESIRTHEKECPLEKVPCPYENCSDRVFRQDLDRHAKACRSRTRECPRGCGYLITCKGDTDHNCIYELRTALEILRSDFTSKVIELTNEMTMRLDMQRGYMVQKETTTQSQIDNLKSENSSLTRKIQVLHDLDLERRQQIERLELENKELMSLLRGSETSNTKCRLCPCHSTRGKVTEI